jgi:hypothetical protein
MSQVCQKCFQIIEDGKGHKEWCPYFNDYADILETIFGFKK